MRAGPSGRRTLAPRALAGAVLALTTVAVLGASRSAAQDGDWTIERIVVKHRFAADVGGPARAALSPTGTLVVDEGSNSLIVRDTPASVAAIRGLVSQLDVEPRLVTLRVHEVQRRELERTHSDVRGSASIDARGDARLAVGVVLGRGTITNAARVAQTVSVQSGQRAELSIGGTQPVVVGRSHRGSDVAFQDFGSRLTVEPTVLGDGRVRVRLSPRSTAPVDPRTGVARGASLDTEVVLAPGESLVLGGVDQRLASSASWASGNVREAGAESLVYLLEVSTGSGTATAPAPR